MGYVILAEALGCYAEYVEEPEGIRPALQRAFGYRSNPTRGWGPQEIATPGSVSMTVSAEPSAAANISK